MLKSKNIEKASEVVMSRLEEYMNSSSFHEMDQTGKSISMPIKYSVGVHVFDPKKESFESALHQADKKMYAIKQAKKQQAAASTRALQPV